MWDKGNLHDRMKSLRRELDAVQRALDLDHESIELRKEESAYLHAFNDAILDEELFFKTKVQSPVVK